MSVLPSPVPHPLEFSPFDVPGWAYTALEWVVGFDWPDGNEVATWDVADRWYALATALVEPNDAAFGAVSRILSGYEGSAADGFEEAWRRLAGDESAPLNALLQASDQLGGLVEGAGRDIEGAKLEAWIEIGIFLTELIGMGITVILTLGAASPAAGGLIMATRLAIQQIFRKLVEQLGAKALKRTATHAIKQLGTKEGLRKLGHEALDEGFDEAREELATNGGIQAYQQSTGRSDGFDLNDLRTSAVAGFAGGAASSGAGVGSHGHGGVARGAGGEVLAEFGAAAAFGDLPDAGDLAKSATSGGAGSAVHSLPSLFGGTPLSAPATGISPHLAGPVDAAFSFSSPASVSLASSPPPAALLPSSTPESAIPASPSPASPTLASPSTASPTLASPSPASPTLASPLPASPSPAELVSPFANPADSVSTSPSLTDSVAAPAAPSDPVPASTPNPADGQALTSSSTAADLTPTSTPDLGSSTAGPSTSSAAGFDFSASGFGSSADPGSPSTAAPASSTPALSSTADLAAQPAPAVQTQSGFNAVAASTAEAAVLSTSSSTPAATAGMTPWIPSVPRRFGPSATGTADVPNRLPPGTTRRAPMSDLDRIADALGPRTASSRRRPPLPLDRTPTTHKHLSSSEASLLDQALAPPSPLSDRPRSRPHANAPVDARPYINRIPSPRRPAPVIAAPLPKNLTNAPRKPLPPPDLARAEAAYFGYADHARRTHELNRREEYASYLTQIADDNRAKILDLGRLAGEADRVGYTLRARDYRHQASELSEVVTEIETQVEQIRTGTVAPDTVEVDPPAWSRINRDVGDLAPGGVSTDDRSALTGTAGPSPIDATRHYNSVGGLRPPLAIHQVDLENAVPRDLTGRPTRLPDPREGTWFRLANDGGPTADPTRGLNCVDGVLSLFDTYIHGRPRVAAPRTFDTYAHGDPTRPLGGELAGVDRIRQATGGDFQSLCPHLGGVPALEAQKAMNLAFTNLSNHLLNTGHGSFAFIITDLEAGGCHSWSAVNHNGTVLFLDPQIGKLSETRPFYHHSGTPAPTNITSMDALVVTATGTPSPLPHHGPGQWSTTPTGTDNTLPDMSPEATAETLAFQSLSSAEQNLLNETRARSLEIADRALQDIQSIVEAIPPSGEAAKPRVVDTQHRAKTATSLARAFLQLDTFDGTTLDRFVAAQKDLVRFSVEIPLAGYGQSVAQILEGMRSAGYTVTKILSFWADRLGRHNGLNVSLTDPNGHLLEVQFPTALSRAVGKDTHALYSRVRNDRFSAEERVEALLEIFSVNHQRGLVENQPSDLDTLNALSPVVNKDTGLASWIRSNRRTWLAYLRSLESSGESFGQVLARHNLQYSDVMMSPDEAGTGYS
ncbi:toxin glutamine deamidase domain-containing protein [Paractinoplanes atraurantiacus]|uniref:Papain fold toxin 1, glutamine deamidase n=1 Tax=Paractinoplanes atraurantiacus TaxID=1036182 RepID=A0A285JFP8_9ACTN|nr:toxin glutamine deamidase domain-containing protein [Actinoplanes atraurantiacus]SNY58627.1 Papain fold toxin 1, glutamine deamidase [Actinoplanes atraurantiacus]